MAGIHVGIHTGVSVTAIESIGNHKRVRFACSNSETTLEVEQVCLAIGQKPLLEGLGLKGCGIACDNRSILIDERMRTNVADVYAAGDVTGKAMLAYVAEAQGRVAAENALGVNSTMDYTFIPRCVYTASMNMAGVGLTEAEARSRGLQIKILRSDLAANPAAAIAGERRGIVKLVVEEPSGTILGAHIAATGASTLIGELTLAVRMKATSADLKNTLHAHPTLSEAVWQAALTSD